MFSKINLLRRPHFLACLLLLFQLGRERWDLCWGRDTRKKIWTWKLNPLTSYLFVNYLDQFLSCYELPLSSEQSRPRLLRGKAWIIQLLSVTCLYPAAKMDEDDVPLSLHLHLLAHSTLKWRMQSVTPFSFVDYFLHKINGSIPGPCELVPVDQFLEFKPFEIAPAVAVSVSNKSKSLDFNNALSCSPHVENGKSIGSVSSVPQSPIRVLDSPCLSYKNDDKTVGSCSSSHTSPTSKNWKLN
ncbi:hypothetical protein AMTRI_Chr09g23140 [Amborella trichopoda]